VWDRVPEIAPSHIRPIDYATLGIWERPVNTVDESATRVLRPAPAEESRPIVVAAAIKPRADLTRRSSTDARQPPRRRIVWQHAPRRYYLNVHMRVTHSVFSAPAPATA